MSKENNNLRLLGSPVNLNYRSKRKEDKKNIRNRPRSALQNSCFTPDIQESYKRPFSADAKERIPSTRTFLKAFSAELLQSYNNSPIKVLPPTTDILGEHQKSQHRQSLKKDKDICSNASDHGSEDTFISLGSKIKARAQLRPKSRSPNAKSLKYRNIVRKNNKPMENTLDNREEVDYGLEIKITERQRSPSPGKNKQSNLLYERCVSPTLKVRPYESYFLPLEGSEKTTNILQNQENETNAHEVEKAIDTYTRRLTLTKQQLSLVEEESTQDLDSVPSQNLSSLSPENSLDNIKASENDAVPNQNTYAVEVTADYPKTQNFICEPRTYTNFYDDFHTNNFETYKSKMSSTVVHTDSSSKDSGYPDSGANDEKLFKQTYSLPPASPALLKKSSSHAVIEGQPKSLDSISTGSTEKCYNKTFPFDKKWTEPLNHSRLLYKDFFIRKEGHIALPPQNSPHKNSTTPDSNELGDAENSRNETKDPNYPSYLMNSTTKAYTSKVIEDYKKELEAINNLHELTLKDLKTDAISPTPLNIDKMFEQNSNLPSNEIKNKSDSDKYSNHDDISQNNNENIDSRDVSKISTRELIRNYFKVKGDYSKDNTMKMVKESTKTPIGKEIISTPKLSNTNVHENWNNKNCKQLSKSITPMNVKNNTQKNLFATKIPLSARLESVQNDKDVDSWMSLSAPSPRMTDIHEIESPKEMKSSIESDTKTDNTSSTTPNDKHTNKEIKEPPKSTELSSNSTVFDIYSMLKEIESYGESPVTTVANTVTPSTCESKKEDEPPPPKDNFMEIFEFLEKVEQSATDALSVVTSGTPQTIPKLESLLKLPQTELAQRLVTASLQLEERSCCIALLQESLTNHKEQMISKVSNLEKQSLRNIAKVKQECEETIKRHQNFIDQLINDKKTLNHRIEQLVDERRSLEERWKRSAQALEERYKLELRNQHDKMAAAQQVARQRWVRQKAEKIKELTVKGLEGELREMAERQQKEVSDLKMLHAEHCGRMQAKHAADIEELRRSLEEEKEAALVKERQVASARLEKQILELELGYQEQRTRLVGEMRLENDRVAKQLAQDQQQQKMELENWKADQEKILQEKRQQMEEDIAKEREKNAEDLKQKEKDLEERFEQFKKDFEAEQQVILKRKVTEISLQHKQKRDREIERAIESMEAEAQAGRKELQEALRRNKEQYEAELKEVAATEQATLRRYQESQARARDAEDRCAELEVSVNQLETRNKVLVEKNSQLEVRVEEIRVSCEESWRKKTEDLNKEMESLKKTHEEQMHQLYAKVKVAVARKDSAIQALTRETAKYQEKIILLEQKLQQQRKDFLKQK